MSKVLYIKANPKSTKNSFTFQVSEDFINQYKENNPSDEVEVVDLYNSDIDFLHGDDVSAMPSGGTEKMQKYAKQFIEADKYVIASPMWNFSIPAILKAYIDYITISGVTFKYGENGPVGFAKGGAKLLHITARGGSYSESPMDTMEMGDRYLRVIMGFLGIKNIETIAIEKVAMGEAGKKELIKAKEKALALVKEW